MAFAIKRRPLPPLNGTNFHPFFTTLFFLLQLNLTHMKHILHLASVKNITFKSSYNWFKIDILRLVRPGTACLGSPQLLYIHNVKLKLCAKCVLATGSDSRWVLSKKKDEKPYWNSRTPPPPHHGKFH